MLNSQVVPIQEKIRHVLQEAGISRAGLFGSCARGEMNEASDVDILVEIKKNISLFDFVELKQKLEDVLERRVDLIEYGAIKPFLHESILSQEVRIMP